MIILILCLYRVALWVGSSRFSVTLTRASATASHVRHPHRVPIPLVASASCHLPPVIILHHQVHTDLRYILESVRSSMATMIETTSPFFAALLLENYLPHFIHKVQKTRMSNHQARRRLSKVKIPVHTEEYRLER